MMYRHYRPHLNIFLYLILTNALKSAVSLFTDLETKTWVKWLVPGHRDSTSGYKYLNPNFSDFKEHALNLFTPGRWFSDLSMQCNQLGGLLKLVLSPILLSDLVGLGRGLRIRLLTSSQVMSMLLVQEAHFENHYISTIIHQWVNGRMIDHLI